MVKKLDSKSKGCRFHSRLFHCRVTTLLTVHCSHASVTGQYNLVLAKGRFSWQGNYGPGGK